MLLYCLPEMPVMNLEVVQGGGQVPEFTKVLDSENPNAAYPVYTW